MTGFILFPPKQQKRNKVNRRRMREAPKEGDVLVGKVAFNA